ncbi:MAG: alpha/beta hydrolase [Candidatus Omnitrophota bacterium]
MIKNIVYTVVIGFLLLAYFRYFEYRSLYFPEKDIESTPEFLGLRYEDIYFKAQDGTQLNAWFIPKEAPRFTILFCHGNGGNISHRIEKIALLNALNLNVFIFDYRGYGRSSGRPSEKGFYDDAGAAYNYLVSEKNIPPEKIVLYGESLGGAVAIDIAAKKTAGALIAESAFTSTKDMARVVYPFFPTFFISSKFDSAKKIQRVYMPKLIIYSQADEIVPFSQSERLFKLAPEPKERLRLLGGHNTCCEDSKDLYISGIDSFLKNRL